LGIQDEQEEPVRIVVLVKEVPDTYGDRHIALETGLVDRVGSDAVIDEIGERTLEAALTIAESGTEATVRVIAMGPASAETGIRKTLAMGAEDAVHIVDDTLLGADLTLTAEVLAAAVRRSEPDLVLLGNVSTDGGGGVMGAMLAELLGMPQATNLASIECDGSIVRGARTTDVGVTNLEVTLPAVASITEALPDPRFPSFKGIMAAKKKTIEQLSAAELAADVLGEQSARAIMLAASQAPAREAGVKVVDEGDGGVKLAEFLTQNKLV
jgi:electron transfer flavoprotein beta subunit